MSVRIVGRMMRGLGSRARGCRKFKCTADSNRSMVRRQTYTTVNSRPQGPIKYG